MVKYELTGETTKLDSTKLHRIKCVEAFGDVKAGDLGGWIESEDNLCHSGNAWIYDNAIVYGGAIVFGNAKVRGKAQVYGPAEISGDAEIGGHAQIHGDAEIRDHVKIHDDAEVGGHAVICDETEVFGDAEIVGDVWINGDAKIRTSTDYTVHRGLWEHEEIYFTYTSSNRMWSSGRDGFSYLTGKELIKAAYGISEFAGQCCEVMVKAQEETDTVRMKWETKYNRLDEMKTIMQTCHDCIKDGLSKFECPFRDAQSGGCGFREKMTKAINDFNTENNTTKTFCPKCRHRVRMLDGTTWCNLYDFKFTGSLPDKHAITVCSLAAGT